MSHTPKIPFLDLIAPHHELHDDLTAVFHRALNTASFIGGPMVEDFERDFAACCHTRHCVGVGSGTDALRFALIAAGIGPGCIVLTVPNTFIATTEAISQSGARPAFIDIDERTYNMDPRKLARYLSEDCYIDGASGHLIHRALGLPVKAIVPVHLYGQPADMDPILDLAAQCNLIVIEDACQAHFADYLSKADNSSHRIGSIGLAAAFSFYPGKNLGACGEAGAVTTNDPALAAKIRMLRDHGQTRKYYHQVEGYNGRLDAIQAGILSVKLKHLPQWTASRRQAAARYRDLFLHASRDREGAVTPPFEPEFTRPVHHLYVVRVPDRDAVMHHLAESGIGTAIHYPVPLHLQKGYESLGYRPGDFPVAEKVAAEIISLPMYPQLTFDQQARVVSCLAAQPVAAYSRAVA